MTVIEYRLEKRESRGVYGEEVVDYQIMEKREWSISERKTEKFFERSSEMSVSREFIDGRYVLYAHGHGGWGKHIFGIEDNPDVADKRLKEKASELIGKANAHGEYMARHPGASFD